MTILDEIAAYTSKRMAAEEEQVSTASLRRQALAMASAERETNGGASPFRFSAALAKPGLSFICEVKKASPSKGVIAEEFPYLDIAKSYFISVYLGKCLCNALSHSTCTNNTYFHGKSS